MYEKLYKRNSVTLANTTKLKYLQIQGRIQMYSYEYLGKVPILFSMCCFTTMNKQPDICLIRSSWDIRVLINIIKPVLLLENDYYRLPDNNFWPVKFHAKCETCLPKKKYFIKRIGSAKIHRCVINLRYCINLHDNFL